jgi:hypothetical protein
MSSLSARFPGGMPARLPFVRRRKTPLQRALETAQSAMKVYTSLKVAQAGPRAAKRFAQGYVAARGARAGGRGLARVGRFAALPAGAAAGFVLFKRVTRGNPVRDSPPKGFAPPATPSAPPVSMGGNAPGAGQPGAPKSGTTTASPSPSPSPGTTGDGGASM